LQKAGFHAQIPLITNFCSLLVDINTYIKPRLYILDAIVAMEGNGPNSGDPKKLGCLLLSTDPVALDATACRMIALDPEHVPTSKAGQKAGLGTYRIENISLVGDTVTFPVDPSFKVVRMPAMSLSGSGILSRIKSMMLPKPVIDHARCTTCGRCVETCPVAPKALAWVSGQEKKQPPYYMYSRCIRCFCCQEICPSMAIVIKTPFVRFLLPLLSLGTVIVSGIRFIIRHVKKKMSTLVFGKMSDKK
jgi:Pyruvate/2-oxoacid:ferredoxin oxidoreductase delta subunit